MKKIIFIEGVSGVGKSTATAMLCGALNERGLRALCYLEGDTENPVDFYNCAYLTKTEFNQILQAYPHDMGALISKSIQEPDYVLVRYGDSDKSFFAGSLLSQLKAHEGFYAPAQPIGIAAYTQVYVNCWQRFLQQDHSNIDYIIFDGGFLYHRSNDLMRDYGADNETIASHLNSLLNAMCPYNPLIFYLSTDDVGKRFVLARESRGDPPATEQRITQELNRKVRQLQILELLPIKANVLDVSSGWEKVVGEILHSI
jgi:hypothetical protein